MGCGMEARSLSDDPREDHSHLKNERFVAAFNEMFESLAVLERFALLEFVRYETRTNGRVIIT